MVILSPHTPPLIYQESLLAPLSKLVPRISYLQVKKKKKILKTDLRFPNLVPTSTWDGLSLSTPPVTQASALTAIFLLFWLFLTSGLIALWGCQKEPKIVKRSNRNICPFQELKDKNHLRSRIIKHLLWHLREYDQWDTPVCEQKDFVKVLQGQWWPGTDDK